MTREEAKNKFKLQTNGADEWYHIPRRTFHRFIDFIYDDFESRICKNCKYYYKCSEVNGICRNNKMPLFEIRDENFGYNRFERINNERN